MTQPWVDDAKYPMSSASPSGSHPAFGHFSSQSSSKHSHRNVLQLLAWREVSPRSKHSSKRLWGETSKCDSIGRRFERTDARHALVSWVEAESLRHLAAEYCPLMPPPRSTIAAAFSSDGKTLASTHGDHTVKVIDCQTGSCLKVLSGHRRTPWVETLFTAMFYKGTFAQLRGCLYRLCLRSLISPQKLRISISTFCSPSGILKS